MRRLFATLALAAFCMTPYARAQEGYEPFPRACDKTFTESVSVANADIQVTTSFVAADPGSAQVWPVIRQTATYSNGEKLIDREFGEKFIDDDVPCAIWYEQGHAQILRDLAAAPQLSKAGEYISREIQDARACLESISECEARSDAWRFTDALKLMTLDQFDVLIAEDPRIFYLKEAAYLGQVMLLDTKRRRLVPILQGGC